MKIIETNGAPNPRRVRMFLAEKGISVPFEERNLIAGELRTADFTAINPWQRVPVLILDDGTAISESIAICRYFEALNRDPPLFGEGALGVAVTEMWNRRVEHGLFAAVAHVFRHLHPRMAANEVPQIAVWGEANKPKVVAELELLDGRLASSRFIAGDNFSVADITAFVAIGFMKPSKLVVPTELSNVLRWQEEVAARPSAAALTLRP